MRRSLRILVIEDHIDLAANICDYLEEHGHLADSALDAGGIAPEQADVG